MMYVSLCARYGGIFIQHLHGASVTMPQLCPMLSKNEKKTSLINVRFGLLSKELLIIYKESVFLRNDRKISSLLPKR